MQPQLTVHWNMKIEHIEHALYTLLKDVYLVKAEEVNTIEGFSYSPVDNNISYLVSIDEGKMKEMLPSIKEEILKMLETSGDSAFVWGIDEIGYFDGLDYYDTPLNIFVKRLAKDFFKMFKDYPSQD